MDNPQGTQDNVKISVEKTIDLIREVRNNLVKEFLTGENLQIHFKKEYGKDISAVKIEFLKRDLRDLLIAPVDLSHYSSLIKQVREANTATLTTGHQALFYSEMETIFKKYNY